MLIVLPGTVAPSRLLLDVLREQHHDRRDAYRLAHAFREKHGVPSTPDIDWSEERRRFRALVEAVDLEDAALVTLGCQAALIAMSKAPTDPGEWSAPAGLEHVRLTPRILSARECRRLRSAWVAALEANDRAAIVEAEDALLLATIVEVAGVDVVDSTGSHAGALLDLTDDDVRASVRDSGLSSWLLSASLYLQSLPAGKAYRSGVLLPQT